MQRRISESFEWHLIVQIYSEWLQDRVDTVDTRGSILKLKQIQYLFDT